jgi:hypothetical protein
MSRERRMTARSTLPTAIFAFGKWGIAGNRRIHYRPPTRARKFIKRHTFHASMTISSMTTGHQAFMLLAVQGLAASAITVMVLQW